MVLEINKVDDKEIIMWWCIMFVLNLKLNESRNQSAQSSLGSIELPKRTRSIQVRKPEIQQSKGKERSHIEGSRTGQEIEWKISIDHKLQQASNDDAERPWTKHCIYRIPQYLRDNGDEKAYIPQIVSLGPYHHGKNQLCNMDQHKWRVLNLILKRNNQRIELYLDKVKKLEERARSCYEGTIGLSSNEFAEMMVLDSCFMLEIFRVDDQGIDELEYSEDDPIFVNLQLILSDMLKLENQIPLFILDELWSLWTHKPHQTGDVIRLALKFFSCIRLIYVPLEKEFNKLESAIGRACTLSGQHCLEVFRQYLIQGSHTNRDESRLIHCFTELKGCLEVFRQYLIQTETERSHTNCVANEDESRLIRCVTELKGCLEVFMQYLIQTETEGSHTNRVANEDESRLIHCVTELKGCLEVFRQYFIQTETEGSHKDESRLIHCVTELKDFLEVFRQYLIQTEGSHTNRAANEYGSRLIHCVTELKGCLEVFRQYLIQTETEGSHTNCEANEYGSQLIHCVTELKGCLEVFRQYLIQTETEGSQANEDECRPIRCVTELKEAGINFKRRDTDRFCDIKFENGVLEIPRLIIQDETKSLFLNLIAYEQSHPKCTTEITSYAFFMDSLINTVADVSYLHYKGIVENWLGNDDDVAELFNRLCKDVYFDLEKYNLTVVLRKVNEHYDRKWNVWKASLRYKYFNSPWAIISLVAAVMLLLLTLAQTIYTVYAFYSQS